jgi:hypothetical protein
MNKLNWIELNWDIIIPMNSTVTLMKKFLLFPSTKLWKDLRDNGAYILGFGTQSTVSFMLTPHCTHWIACSWYPKGSIDMMRKRKISAPNRHYIYFIYSWFTDWFWWANIIINDMKANSALYMMCTSYTSTFLEGMWKSIKITCKPGF